VVVFFVFGGVYGCGGCFSLSGCCGGCRGFFLGGGGGGGGVEWLGLVVYHSLPSSAKVKNEWDYTSSNYAFMACTGTTLCFQEESAILQE